MDELKRGTEVSVQFYGEVITTHLNGMITVQAKIGNEHYLFQIPEEFIEDVG